MPRTIDVTELTRIMDSPRVIILDVVPPEYFASGHIPGAVNACVYEIGFTDRVAELVPDKEGTIVLYDTSDRSQGAGSAKEKLNKAGYRDVLELVGGLEGWLAAGQRLEPEGAQIPSGPRVADGRYLIDCEKSVVAWTGRNIGGRHTGNIAISGGELRVEGGAVLDGRVVIDMTRITNSDLQGNELYKVLIDHLLSEDFFETARYPLAEARLKGSRRLPGATPGRPNYLLDAELTIKDVTRGVTFPAVIVTEGDALRAQAALEIDRTDYNIRYGSGKFFEKLGMHLVHDMISLEFFLTAVPA